MNSKLLKKIFSVWKLSTGFKTKWMNYEIHF